MNSTSTYRDALKEIEQWFSDQGWDPFPFQRECWNAWREGYDGLLNAPTGSGKTYALLVPPILQYLSHRQENETEAQGLKVLWITPLRALSKEIYLSSKCLVEGLELNWEVGIRTGDTSPSERMKQKENPPDILITTPESLHIYLSNSYYETFFSDLESVVIDEWHELMGSKRGVLVELGLSRLKNLLPELRIWGISATIGNMDEAAHVLLGKRAEEGAYRVVRSDREKQIEVVSILPDDIEEFPWAGHIGIRLLHKVIPIIRGSESTIIFTNTRSQCEIWYQRILDADPDLSGVIAMHHGSISREQREWVEQALYDGELKAVVSTSSLDLGVDFRPVDTVVQIGSPKGLARFMQRAGRSGHRPDAVSRIYFVPTHALELVEGAALREGVEEGIVESRMPYIRCFDVLVQYLMTLAISGGFDPKSTFEEVRSTHCYSSLNQNEWKWVLGFLRNGGKSLQAYDEYRKIDVDSEGNYRVLNKSIARRHRMSIGTIIGDHVMRVRYRNGKILGTIEEWFISKLKQGEQFWFAGKNLQLVRIKDNDAIVKRSKGNKGKVPSWLGGRMPLSSQLSGVLRRKIDAVANGDSKDPEVDVLRPLLELQSAYSAIPTDRELLVEYFEDKDGFHLIIYPFEGRLVHEGMAALVAWRIGQLRPMTFSLAMNDYGFELLSDRPLDVERLVTKKLFDPTNLSDDIHQSINEVEMAGRRFRDIAGIAGLIFKGFPGQRKKEKHLQSSSRLIFEVFHDYEPDNLLYLQAFDEVETFQLEESRMRGALRRIQGQDILLTMPDRPTPFAFPIMVDSLRERLSSESLEDRIRRMHIEWKEKS